MEELQHFFGEAAHEIEGLKGIILTGAGEKAFVAGQRHHRIQRIERYGRHETGQTRQS